jgi:hypothetical protein
MAPSIEKITLFVYSILGGANMDKINIGDYVLATKYSDGDPQDHWCVGFYNGTIEKVGCDRFDVVDNDGNSFRGNGFRRIKKISAKRGEWLLENRREIELGVRSVWWWVRRRMSDE